MLAVRRVVRDLVDCPAALCSVCVLLRNKGEHPPPGYRVIRKVSAPTPASCVERSTKPWLHASNSGLQLVQGLLDHGSCRVSEGDHLKEVEQFAEAIIKKPK